MTEQEKAKIIWDKINQQMEKIKLNKANIDHISKTSKINGGLLIDIKSMLFEREAKIAKLMELLVRAEDIIDDSRIALSTDMRTWQKEINNCKQIQFDINDFINK